MAEVKLHLEYVRSLSKDRATLAAVGERLTDENAHGLVADFIARRCGNESADQGAVVMGTGDAYLVRTVVTFDADGDDDLEIYDTAVDFLLPEDGGLSADDCEVTLVEIDGVQYLPEQLDESAAPSACP
jgi:hypothetical protein